MGAREDKPERDFQSTLIEELRDLFPGCIILKNDSAYLQGIPDLVIFYGARYAMLEVKAKWNSIHQPNQDYYVDLFDEWAFGAFIFPENKEEVLNELQQAFRASRQTRLSRR